MSGSRAPDHRTQMGRDQDRTGDSRLSKIWSQPPRNLPVNYRTRVGGKFLSEGGVIPPSQAICSSLLEECFEISHEIKANEDSKNVASSLKPVCDRLSEIRFELENLEIDKMRVDGKFVDWEGNPPIRPIRAFVSSSTMLRPHISTAFLEKASFRGADASLIQANKLTTVKKCLNEVLKYGGPFNPRDLYPHQRSTRCARTAASSASTERSRRGRVSSTLKESMDEGETEEDDEEDFDYSGFEPDEPVKQ
ncbi:hypothetical protein HYPSUDRAFT_208767 [Hypholoma sublateritium FD-334 SS-4]|uniref:Uncharacterized protein n=1 Tax=Hypholoma sublateritium (strain FD-334 SS-4) TaxID=945553 RepID=A0A0D2P125_HYPSF|nr:hypothetical protein HYPSUDRAFT_208767 [Hypholoma sublateritium FD-334 SS-4]